MKSATVASTSPATPADPFDRVTATVVGDDDVARTYTNIGPAPIYDEASLWHYLAAYDAAFVAGEAKVAQGTPVTGALTPPAGV